MIINITVKNRIATYTEGETRPVCGNGGDVVVFTTDAEWEGRTDKIARFLWGNQFHDEPVEGDRCPVPAFLNARSVQIGLLAGAEGDPNALATTRATVLYDASVRCGAAAPAGFDVEAYTNEAKDASLAAQDAERRALAAAEGVRNYMESEVTMNSLRIGSLERHLNLADPFVENTNVQAVQGGISIPAGAKRYAKILRLWGTPSKVEYESCDSVDRIPNFPKYMWHGTKNVFELPVSSNIKVDLYEPNLEKINAFAPDFGMDEENYIYTEGERWLYHQGVRYYEGYCFSDIHETYTPAEDEKEIKDYDFKGGYWVTLKEPVVTDITAGMKNKSPYIELSQDNYAAVGVMNNVLAKTVTTADEIYYVSDGAAYATIAFEV